jgi:hypothetical protein
MKYFRKFIFLLCMLGIYLSFKYDDSNGILVAGFMLLHNALYDIGDE